MTDWAKKRWKEYDLARIAWLQRQGSIYFPFSDMVFKYPSLAFFNWLLTAWAGMTGTCVIHVIGDSHARPFIFRWPFLVHHISQATAHNLGQENSTTRSSTYLKSFLSKIDRKRDVVLLVFGEIDARVHIYLQYGKSGRVVSFDTLIARTVERYGRVICQIKEGGFAVCVHGIPPAASKEFITALPYTGKPRERSEISSKFNAALADFCRSIDVPYADIQSIAADESGFIMKRYLADEVHCNERIVPWVLSTVKTAYAGSKRLR